MSTHALIGQMVSSTPTYRAVGVTYDGYPTHMGPWLQAAVKRDGVGEVLAVLRSRHEWSSLEIWQEPDRSRKPEYDVIPGYGEAYFGDETTATVSRYSIGKQTHADYSYVFSSDLTKLFIIADWGRTTVAEISVEQLVSIHPEVLNRFWETIERGSHSASDLLPELERFSKELQV